MNKLQNGFYTAIGTPVDAEGNLVAKSLEKHINQQIDAGAAGLLLMGSMGMEAFLKISTFKEAVGVAVKANNKRLPLFVGAMDTSIAKVKEKISCMAGYDIDGVVLTAPFYFSVSDEQAVNWFTRIADSSPYPIYIYDLAVAAKYKITMPVLSKLIVHPNIRGIKTADWELIHAVGRLYPNADFECLYSGLDSFDYANMMGIGKNLDGMFSCTPKNGKKMADANANGDFKAARKYLDNILCLRDTMLKWDLMPSFTYCMNLLGCEGNFHYDFCSEFKEEAKPVLKKLMEDIGEI